MDQYKSAQPPWLSAADACRRLGVTRATLYAYVSRRLVRSEPVSSASRERRYAREDVERLCRRAEERRDPDKAAARTLQWGLPILESSIACIDGAHLYYRGHDAAALSRTRSVEDVASLIWTGDVDRLSNVGHPFGGASEGRGPAVVPANASSEGAFVSRAHILLADASTRDPLAFDLRPDAVARTGWRILALLTLAATDRRAAAGSRRESGGSGRPPSRYASADSRGGGGSRLTIDEALARAWRVSGRGVAILRAALILCADHELNVSSFTARCVASAGSNPYAVVIAGLAALEGTRHGGMSARVEAMLGSLRGKQSPRVALGDRLRRGEPIYGFGHPLYRNGDPRSVALLRQLEDVYPRSAELTYARDVAAAAQALTGEHPTIDFALATLARVMKLPPGSPLTLFAIGRAIGWIGHAIEQYATGQLIRPRAKYIGPPPVTVSKE